MPCFNLNNVQVLLRLLNQNVLVELEKRELEKFPEKQYIYKKGVPCDYFVLILEVLIFVSLSNITFQLKISRSS